MAVCQHCGEPGVAGALFCTKCGFTLPQGEATAPPAAPTPSAPVPPLAAGTGPAGYPTLLPAMPYLAPAASVPGAVGPVAPPPSAKFCVRCGTAIAQSAVYCPVCQQPQP